MMRNICSEVGVGKILNKYGIRDKNMIPILKRCESLEYMMPCVDHIIKKHGKQSELECALYDNVSLEYIKNTASEDNPISIRVVNNDGVDKFLHTINIVGYDKGKFIYDEEDGLLYDVDEYELKKWRYEDYAFMCKRKQKK